MPPGIRIVPASNLSLEEAIAKRKNAGAVSQQGGGGSHKGRAQEKHIADAVSGAGRPKKSPKKAA